MLAIAWPVVFCFPWRCLHLQYNSVLYIFFYVPIILGPIYRSLIHSDLALLDAVRDLFLIFCTFLTNFPSTIYWVGFPCSTLFCLLLFQRLICYKPMNPSLSNYIYSNDLCLFQCHAILLILLFRQFKVVKSYSSHIPFAKDCFNYLWIFIAHMKFRCLLLATLKYVMSILIGIA